jgi:NADPH:quinone reductase
MRAVAVNDYGEAPSLMEVADPQAGPGQVSIRIEATGINPMDRKLVDGRSSCRRSPRSNSMTCRS